MCAECGAPDDECTARIYELLAREFGDPAYGRVHNLTVGAYMLQHSSRLTREGWLYERDLMREFLVDGVPPERIRKERKDTVDSGKRTFKIRSRTGLPVIPHVPWARTVLDVRTATPEQYCEDVTAWARATLTDAEHVEI